MDGYVTWAYLATDAGTLAMTCMITQWIKNLGVLQRVPTQLLTLVLAFVVMVPATFFAIWLATGAPPTPDVWALIPYNAVGVSLAANGAYAGIQRIKG